MTSELKADEIISEYVGAGPKNYAYKTFNSVTGEHKTVCKVRGITLNYNAFQLVNFDKIKEMIMNRDPNETITVHTENKIKRKKTHGGVQILTEPLDKIYRVCFLKRRRLSDGPSVPFEF
jgi:hypothetical protein